MRKTFNVGWTAPPSILGPGGTPVQVVQADTLQVARRITEKPTCFSGGSVTGIFLPETAKEKPQEGKVIAAGPGARTPDGERIAMDVKVGDIILYARYSGAPIKLQSKQYLIFKENDVLAIVLNEQP